MNPRQLFVTCTYILYRKFNIVRFCFNRHFSYAPASCNPFSFYFTSSLLYHIKPMLSGWTMDHFIIIKQSRLTTSYSRQRLSAAYAFMPRRRWSNDFGRLAKRAEYLIVIELKYTWPVRPHRTYQIYIINYVPCAIVIHIIQYL